jgi:hypothetical protein
MCKLITDWETAVYTQNCGWQATAHTGFPAPWEAYSHEVSSAGYWPGPDGEGVFYCYAPTPSLRGIGARPFHRPRDRSMKAWAGDWDDAKT